MTLRVIALMGFISFCCMPKLWSQDFSISGSVVEHNSLEPLAGAVIQLLPSTKVTQSDSKGQFSFAHLPPKTYTLSVTYLGYKEQQIKVHADKNIKSVRIELKPLTYDMSEVVITGTGTQHNIDNAPVKTEVITGDQIKSFSGRNIEDVLSSLSASISFSASEMGSGLQLNGLKNDYVLILLDGKRMSTSSTGQVDLSRINMDNLDRIELVKGASSSLYGSDAIGGVINFISKKTKKTFAVNNNTRIGQHEDINQSNNIGFGNEWFQANTSFNLKHTHGWRNTTQEWHRNRLYENSVTKTVNRSTNYTVGQTLAFYPTPKLEISTALSYYERRTYRPMGVPNWRYSNLFFRVQDYSATAKYKLNNRSWISLSSSWDKNDYYYDYQTREYTDYYDHQGNRIVHYTGDRVLQSSERKWINNVKSAFYFGDKNIFYAGLEHVWEELVAPYRLSSSEKSNYYVDVYAQDEWNVTDRLNLTAGLRYGYHKGYENTVTPKISALYKLGKFNFRATYSQGYKVPTIKELYYHYYSTIMSKFKAYYGNPDLKPQRSNYYAFNVEYIFPKLKLSSTVYYNQIRNLISLQSTSTSYDDLQLLVEETMHYVNLAKAKSFGIDNSIEYKPRKDLKLRLNYSYLKADAQRTDDETVLDYMKFVPMDGTSRHNISFNSSWEKAWKKYQLVLSLTGRYQSRRYYTSHGNAKAYQIWRFNTLHHVLKSKTFKVDINAGIDNIFDYVDRTPFGHNRGTTSPGRNYYVSFALNYQLKPNK